MMTSLPLSPCVFSGSQSSLFYIFTNLSIIENNNSTTNKNDLLFNFLPKNRSHLCAKSVSTPAWTKMQALYCYATPILIVIGILGNSLSLRIFTTRPMRRLEASVYLSALSISDLAALLCYVLVDWMRRGAPYMGYDFLSDISVFEIQGICQLQMYLSYVTRFLSAWIIVTFTVERYVAVCHPLRRRGLIFGSRSSYKILLILLVISFILMVYKPVLTARYEFRVKGLTIARCSRNPAHQMLSFILDSIFAVFITFIPFLIITILNTLIIFRLYHRHRRLRTHIVTEESVVRMEFTITFLVISFVFIAVNLPYFGFWCNRFLRSFYSTNLSLVAWESDSDDAFTVTRIIFYLNYSINFFLYSVSGACFRRELRLMCLNRNRNEYHSCNSRASNHSNLDIQMTHSNRSRNWV